MNECHRSEVNNSVLSVCPAFCSVKLLFPPVLSWNWFHERTSGISYGETNKCIGYSYFTSAFERLFGFPGNICTCPDNWPNKVSYSVASQRGTYLLYIRISIRSSVEVWSSANDVQASPASHLLFILCDFPFNDSDHAVCIAPKSIRLSYFFLVSYLGKIFRILVFRAFSRVSFLLFLDSTSKSLTRLRI